DQTHEIKFHEFGHGLQHMLTQVDYPGAAGINNIEWDAVELPSQFMENWCYDRATLMGMAKHYETGEPLPEHFYQKLLAARNYMSGSAMLRQLHFSFVDIELHHRYQPGGNESAAEVRNRIAKTTTILPPLPEDKFLCAFGHIFAGGYAAGYYSYKWAEVLSADAFAAFEEAGLEDEEAISATGKRYRDTVLALGGGLHPMEVFKAFRGREPITEALLKHSGLVRAC
ncbi:MAG: M3 family metallopeptidase, partial [Symploca sp. SIO1C4]|nr:M3 family metallopeptidase [Symploca sp. SIO1C4]